MGKRILSVWLTLCMMVSLIVALSITATAATSGYYGQCGDNVYWEFNCETDSLTLSGNGTMYNYSTNSQPPWQSLRPNIENILIESDITSIGNCAFLSCTNLTSVTISDSVTSIASDAFSNCENLTSITIPDSVTTIGKSAFFNCKSLTSVTIPDSVTTLGESVFEGCSSMTGAIIGNGVTSIKTHAFYGCTGLSAITIGNSVTSIGSDAFFKCESLANVTIPKGVTSITGGAFAKCSTLASITISESVESIDPETFWGSTSLADISVNPKNDKYSSSNGDLYNKEQTELVQFAVGKSDTSFIIPNSVVSIGHGAFFGNSNLTNITIPNSVKYINGTAFKNCTALTDIELPGSVILVYPGSFQGCINLHELTVSQNNPNYSSLNGDLYNKSQTELIQYAIGKKDNSFVIPDSVTSIGDYAFYGCSLTSVTIPNSVTKIGDRAFSYCDNLKDVYYPDTQEQWYKIRIQYSYAQFTSATIHYNSMGPKTGNMLQTVSVKNNSVTVGVKNISNTDYDSVMLVVGIYDENKHLLDTKPVSISNFVSGYTADDMQIPFDGIPANSHIKVFLWKSFSDLTPLCESRNLPVIK